MCDCFRDPTRPDEEITLEDIRKLPEMASMERAGAEDMGDDVERKGLGTPATRADIIEIGRAHV